VIWLGFEFILCDLIWRFEQITTFSSLRRARLTGSDCKDCWVSLLLFRMEGHAPVQGSHAADSHARCTLMTFRAYTIESGTVVDNNDILIWFDLWFAHHWCRRLASFWVLAYTGAVTLKQLHYVSKKCPTCKLSLTLSNFNRFSKLLHCWKAYEICYKSHMTIPPYLKHVATLPWEIKHSNFLQIFSRFSEGV